jgi:replication factor C subunit 3/5
MELPMRGEAPPKEKDELITNGTIYNYIAAPHPADIWLVMTTLVNTPDVTSCLSTINTLKSRRGLALAGYLDLAGGGAAGVGRAATDQGVVVGRSVGD